MKGENKIEQAKNLLFSFREWIKANSGYAPFITMMGSLFGFIIFSCGLIKGSEPDYILTLDALGRGVFDWSLICLGLMFGFSQNWRFISWVSYICLIALYITNTVYILFRLAPDLFFLIFASIIYITFVVLTIRCLTNR